MKEKILAVRVMVMLISCLFIFSYTAQAQAKNTKKSKTVKAKKDDGPYAPGPLFDDDSLIHFTLSANLKETYNDRGPDEVDEHPGLLQYTNSKNQTVAIPIDVKTRGHFRRMRENCYMPPLWIDIKKEAKLKGTLFEKQNKLKLVTPCVGDEYVVREYLIYKIYNLLSPQCLRARLAMVTYEDSAGKHKTKAQYSVLIEDDDKAARRNGHYIEERKGMINESLNINDFTRLAVFEYLIGNTDWSVPYLHNIKLAFKDSVTIPTAIPYDFDHSGMVNAPYAHPPEQLGLRSVQERRYRGYCIDMAAFKPTFELFNKLKDKIYKIYTGCPYIDDKYKKYATRYLDDFYDVINNEKKAEREFSFPCINKERINIGGYEN